MRNICIVLAILLLVGCSTLNYQSADGTTVQYTRILTKTDSISGQVGKAKVEVRGQNVNLDALQVVTEAAVKAATEDK